MTEVEKEVRAEVVKTLEINGVQVNDKNYSMKDLRDLLINEIGELEDAIKEYSAVVSLIDHHGLGGDYE